MHIPFHSVYLIPFLRAVKKKYKPDKVVCLGDELDLHGSSFHDHSPDLHSPKDELEMSIPTLRLLYKIFPEVDVLESNHGSLYYRRAAASYIPKRVIKPYRDYLEAPKGWRWHADLVLYASDGNPIYFCHAQSADALKNSKNKSMNYVQGHHHSKFSINYWANSLNLYWGMTSGCLIDYKSLAFEYGRTILDKPIIGCSLISNGHPQLIPLVLDKCGRWINKLP